jgi:hypothetical protein
MSRAGPFRFCPDSPFRDPQQVLVVVVRGSRACGRRVDRVKPPTCHTGSYAKPSKVQLWQVGAAAAQPKAAAAASEPDSPGSDGLACTIGTSSVALITTAGSMVMIV